MKTDLMKLIVVPALALSVSIAGLAAPMVASANGGGQSGGQSCTNQTGQFQGQHEDKDCNDDKGDKDNEKGDKDHPNQQIPFAPLALAYPGLGALTFGAAYAVRKVRRA